MSERKAFRQHVLLRAAASAGIEGLTTHHLRHTAVSLAIKSGAGVKVVQRMVGYKSAAMTLDVYGRLWGGGLDELATRLDRDLAAIVPDLYRTPYD